MPDSLNRLPDASIHVQGLHKCFKNGLNPPSGHARTPVDHAVVVAPDNLRREHPTLGRELSPVVGAENTTRSQTRLVGLERLVPVLEVPHVNETFARHPHVSVFGILVGANKRHLGSPGHPLLAARLYLSDAAHGPLSVDAPGDGCRELSHAATCSKLTVLSVLVTLLQVTRVKLTVLLLLKLRVATKTKNFVQPVPLPIQTLAKLPARRVLDIKSLVIRA